MKTSVSDLERILNQTKQPITDALIKAEAISNSRDIADGAFDDNLPGIIFNGNDPDNLYQHDQIRNILKEAAQLLSDLEYLQRPVSDQSQLKKNRSGYYCSANKEYHAGSSIEYLETSGIYEDEKGNALPYWKRSRVEYDADQHDYYIVGHNGPLECLTVREKK